ncbi:MAG: hypothetical protein JKX88_07600 [Marinicaulis sp.]|nr:hypothetical protein [Marinicaulis sp.]
MFENRNQAGAALADALAEYAEDIPVIYALLRGGAPVAAEVAKRLNAPLDLILVRKIGAPGQSELAIGAVVDGAAPTIILHEDIIRDIGVSDSFIQKAKEVALTEIEERRKIFFRDHKQISPAGKTAIIVDDGLATGATMEAAVKAMRKAGAKRIVVAIPVAPSEAIARFRSIVDDVICLETPTPFWSVGNHYHAFPQLTNADVIRIQDEFEGHGIERPSSNSARRSV